MPRLGVLAFVLVLAAGAVLGAESAAPTTAQQEPAPLTVQEVSLVRAQAAIAAAIAAAGARDTTKAIAIVDANNLKAFARMDGAWLASVDVAIKKARSSALLQTPTGAIEELVQPGGPLFGAEISKEGLITYPGGVPLMSADGAVIGAIGVSGSAVDSDQAVAEAGAAALGG
jgi:uncharacterized protein GlcG (DUF336 family)